MHIILTDYTAILYLFLISMGFLAGFIDAISGGGGLISVPALALSGMPLPLVLGTNKLQSAIGTSVAVYNYYKNGLINFATVARGLVTGLMGAILGAITVNHIPNHFMQYIVPFLLLIILFLNIFNPSLGLVAGKKRINEQAFFAIFGFILGFYDAFFGPGTGNFWIIAIVFFLGYDFLNASAYAKVLNLKSNLFSLIIFIYFNQVNFIIGLLMACGQFIGGYMGAKMVIGKGSKVVRPLFITVVAINIVVLFYQLCFKR